MRVSAWCLVLGAWCVVGCGKPGVERVEWPAMGTIAAVQFRGGPADCDAVRTVQEAFRAVEREFSAFDRESVVNRTGSCSPFGRPCWDFAFALKEQTGGAFNPRWQGEGRLDFGAIAKGFAVDVAAERVRAKAPPPMCDVLIDLGGNLKAVKGDWIVGVKDGETFTLCEGGACATSARYFRGNHIKEGRDGSDVTNGIHSVTVIHPSSAMAADGLSTVMFILGKEEGRAFLETRYPAARALWIGR